MHNEQKTWETFTSSLYMKGGFADLYMPVLTYVISLFTGNPRWLFMIFAIVFGFFYSRNMWFILDRLPANNSNLIWILVAFFFLICPIWDINGARMWTALHIFMYGALPYLITKEKKKLIWCFAALFVHFSYFIPLAILIVYHFIPKSVTPLLIFFIISIFIDTINIIQVRTLLESYLPDFLQPRVRGYTNEDYYQSVMEGRSGVGLNVYVYLSNQISKWSILILLICIPLFFKKTIEKDYFINRLFCFTLLIYSISNILSLIPSGSRFLTVSQMFALPAIIFFIITKNKIILMNRKSNMIIKGLIISLLIPIILYIRTGLDFYGISILLNPIIAFFIEDTIPIIQYIKSIL
jgi:hypothetical protein